MAEAPVENPEVEEAPAPGEEPFTLRQRFLIWVLTWLGYLGIRLICPTLRWSVSSEDSGPVADEPGMPVIYTFWHRSVFLATHHYRGRGIVVMTSRSFDGEYIARIIEKFGYGAARGSSTRGGARALLALHKELQGSRSVAFTIDGPKGPRYVAKPGPTLLARNTQAPILCFHVAVERAWVLNTWDEFIIPKPFARAVVRVGKLMRIPRDADSAALDRYHAEMQQTLDRIREQAEKLAAG